jgi:hypothetical protein
MLRGAKVAGLDIVVLAATMMAVSRPAAIQDTTKPAKVGPTRDRLDHTEPISDARDRWHQIPAEGS